ncbi:hypothetical protein GQ42DRAFT_153161 [Ramicandelaber brevisporus]|nr:hypothetical protein GQ42DRAFT_153161 [Ramicandelaber brevisporus]
MPPNVALLLNSLCVACTKQDVLSAQPPERIRSLFETELDRIRNARKAALAGHNTAFGKDSAIGEFDDDAGEEKMLIGKPAEDKMPFKLEHLANDVVFVACASGTPQSSIATIAGMASSNSVSDVRQWITNVYLSKKQ